MKRTGHIAVVLGAMALAACFSKPNDPMFHGGGDGDGGVSDGRIDAPPGSTVDAPIDGPPLPTCTNTDTFDTGNGCGAIGTAYGPGSIVGRSANQLSMAATVTAGGCHSSSAFSFAKGVSIKVVRISESTMTNTTSLRVTNGANATEGMEVIFNDAMGTSVVYDAECLGPLPTPIEASYDQTQPMYWKFEASPNAVGQSVHAYYSANGTSWTDTGVTCPWTSVATVKFDVGVGATAATSSQLALFDDFNVKTCP